MPSAKELVAAGELALGGRYGKVRLVAGRRLAGSHRAHVMRARMSTDGAGPLSVILKTHDGELAPEAAVREAASLDLLTDRCAGICPALLGIGSEPPLVVMEDLGTAKGSPSLAQALLGRDQRLAAQRLELWADALGRLHAATAGCVAEFDAYLRKHAARLGRPAPATDATSELADGAVSRLQEALPIYGLALPIAAIGELTELNARLGGGDAARALTPADACPDNNVVTDDGMRLFDFEGAQARHVAWDVAYLRVPWPSCWCAWAMPEQVTDSALARWREAVVDAIPYVGTEAFEEDLSLASVGWAVISMSWLLRRAAEARQVLNPRIAKKLPEVRGRVQNRLRLVVERGGSLLPALTSVCADLLETTITEWGEHHLALAPAFR